MCWCDPWPQLSKSGENVSTVYWSRTDDRKEFAKRVLSVFGLEICKAQTFLIKPNLVSSECYPTTTHPDLLDVVLELLSGKDVLVADAPAIDAGSPRRIIENSPLKEVCDSHGFPFLNLYETKAKTFVSVRGYRFNMFTLPLERDMVISLPVLKTHNWCQMTGALKNQFGYLSRRDRILMHLRMRDIHKGIAELGIMAKAHVFIVDAVQTLIGAQEARHGGKARDLGYLLAGTDPVSLDCFGLKLLQEVEPKLQGRSPEDILYLKYSLDYHVGSKKFEAEEITV